MQCVLMGLYRDLPLSRGGAKFTKGHTVKTLSELRSLPPSVLWSLVPKTVTLVTCPCHEEEPLKYCCEQCDTLLCQACTVDKTCDTSRGSSTEQQWPSTAACPLVVPFKHMNQEEVSSRSCVHSLSVSGLLLKQEGILLRSYGFTDGKTCRASTQAV